MHSIRFPDQLDSAQFLKQYWQKRPLYMPQAWPDFDNPLPAEELAGLAEDEEMPARIVEQQSATRWCVRQGPFTATDFAELEGKTWSLLITDIEKYLPDFMDYVQPFRFIPDWRFDDLMISYAPPGGSVGPHIDDYDVFLIQAEGQRNWMLEGHFRDLPQPSQDLIPDTDLRLIKDYQCTQAFLCEPGDILYLPPRLGHHGVAKSDCMTWSMGFKAPDLNSVLIDYLDAFEDANEYRRYTDPDLSLQPHPGEITEQQLRSLKQWFVQQIQGDDERFARWAGKFLSRSPLGDEFGLDSTQMIADRLEVEPNPFIRFEFMRLKNKTYLFVAGEEYEISLELAKQLTAKSKVNIQPKNEGDRALISELMNKGYLLKVAE